jgi:hypothetical protein
MSSSDDVESYRRRLWSLFTQMPNWPYRPVSLRPNGEQCKCGAHRASVVDGKATVTGCSRILAGTATGGPEAHTYSGKDEPLQITFK